MYRTVWRSILAARSQPHIFHTFPAMSNHVPGGSKVALASITNNRLVPRRYHSDWSDNVDEATATMPAIEIVDDGAGPLGAGMFATVNGAAIQTGLWRPHLYAWSPSTGRMSSASTSWIRTMETLGNNQRLVTGIIRFHPQPCALSSRMSVRARNLQPWAGRSSHASRVKKV